METLAVGSLAYYEGFGTLIPCKVTKITGVSGTASSRQNVTVTLTANRGAYKRGESLTTWGLHVIPRKSVHHGNRIRCYTIAAPLPDDSQVIR